MLRFAFNTNGCCNHRLDDALELIAESGYQGVALALDHHHLDPFADGYEAAAARLAERLRALDLRLVVDTGARFLMEPREAHEPTLLHPDADGRARRIEFLRRAIRIAAICDAEAVVFFSGRARRSVSQANAGAFLLDGLVKIADMGQADGVAVALKPEPRQMIARLDDFGLVREAIRQATDAPLHLALDVGHCLAVGDRDPAAAVREFAPILGAVAISDMKRGIDTHLPFGEGDMDIPGVLAALDAAGTDKLVTVTLPRDGFRAHDTVPSSMDYLQQNLPSD